MEPSYPNSRFTHNEKKERWDLIKDGASKPSATFETKAEATKGSVLKKLLGKSGGSVKIHVNSARTGDRVRSAHPIVMELCRPLSRQQALIGADSGCFFQIVTYWRETGG